LVLDEAYKEFSEESSDLSTKEESNIVFIRTFSKVWSLAGIRLGYLLAPEWCINMIKAVSLPYHLDSVKQKVGVLALKYEKEMLRKVSVIRDEREKIFQAMLSLPIKVWPSEANFLLFKPEAIDAYKLWEELLEEGILIRDCSSWEGLEGCLRVTIGSENENNSFLDAVRKIVK
jgi:histidinol-phosphate aminotransferase